jgi:hypothetical protein
MPARAESIEARDQNIVATLEDKVNGIEQTS